LESKTLERTGEGSGLFQKQRNQKDGIKEEVEPCCRHGGEESFCLLNETRFVDFRGKSGTSSHDPKNLLGKVWPSAPQRELKKLTTTNQPKNLDFTLHFVVLWSFDHAKPTKRQ
jgi:hypothetical protein